MIRNVRLFALFLCVNLPLHSFGQDLASSRHIQVNDLGDTMYVDTLYKGSNHYLVRMFSASEQLWSVTPFVNGQRHGLSKEFANGDTNSVVFEHLFKADTIEFTKGYWKNGTMGYLALYSLGNPYHISHYDNEGHIILIESFDSDNSRVNIYFERGKYKSLAFNIK